MEEDFVDPISIRYFDDKVCMLIVVVPVLFIQHWIKKIIAKYFVFLQTNEELVQEIIQAVQDLTLEPPFVLKIYD